MTASRRAATVGDLLALLDEAYPPRLAHEWDSVGLIVGDTEATVATVVFALDPTLAVAREAVALGADLLVTHHPLFLRGVHSVATTTPKGRIVHTLIRGGCALFNAHTNADSVAGGVADTLAGALGMGAERAPLEPDPHDESIGIGRVGALVEPCTLAELADRLAAAVPTTAYGVLVGGPGHARVERLAVCPGAGDSLLAAAREAGADAYVSADLRHHPASEHLEDGRPYLISASHFATEWPWVPVAADTLRRAATDAGFDIVTHVSSLVTEPWTTHVRGES